MIGKLLWIAIAGAAGTLLRFAVYQLLPKWTGDKFPWATLAVNVAGCYLFGLFWMLAERKLYVQDEMRLIILAGFMGAFTTYSTFAFETGQMIREGQWGLAFINLTAQTILGVGALFLGFASAQSIS